MSNKILLAILGFNLGVIGIMMTVDTGSLLLNYLIAAGVGGLLAGIGYFAGGALG